MADGKRSDADRLHPLTAILRMPRTTERMAWRSAGSGVRLAHGRRDLRLVRARPERRPGGHPPIGRWLVVSNHAEGSVSRIAHRTPLCCRTAKFCSGVGWKVVMPRKAVLPAPAAATADSAMLFLWNRIPTSLFSRTHPGLPSAADTPDHEPHNGLGATRHHDSPTDLG